jgi:hypothetical protein
LFDFRGFTNSVVHCKELCFMIPSLEGKAGRSRGQGWVKAGSGFDGLFYISHRFMLPGVAEYLI